MCNLNQVDRCMSMRSFFLLSLLITFCAHSQMDTTMMTHEAKLDVLLTSLRSSKSDEEKQVLNDSLKLYFYKVLRLPQAFSYPFAKLKSVGCIDSPDKQVRIINWNVELEEQRQLYTCFVLKFDPKKKQHKVTQLMDNSEVVGNKPEGVLDAKNWYGALYYKVIPFTKLSKPMYLLLGWDGNNSMSTIKMIDVLSFSNDQPKLGHPIFKIKEATQKRIFFEHSKKVVMSLKYEEKYKRIVFDHLSPETPALEGFYSFYVPDFSYDAFVEQGTKWTLYEDVIAVNGPDDGKTYILVKNERTGKVEKKQIKRKWQSPEDRNAPVSGIEHEAITPEMDSKNPVAIERELEKKSAKKDKRSLEQMSTTIGKNKKKRRKS